MPTNYDHHTRADLIAQLGIFERVLARTQAVCAEQVDLLDELRDQNAGLEEEIQSKCEEANEAIATLEDKITELQTLLRASRPEIR